MNQVKSLFNFEQTKTDDIIIKTSFSFTLPQYWRIKSMSRHRNLNLEEFICYLLEEEHMVQELELSNRTSKDVQKFDCDLPF